MTPLKVGEAVSHKGAGGPKSMTVSQVISPTEIECQWFVGGRSMRDVFPTTSLERSADREVRLKAKRDEAAKKLQDQHRKGKQLRSRSGS